MFLPFDRGGPDLKVRASALSNRNLTSQQCDPPGSRAASRRARDPSFIRYDQDPVAAALWGSARQFVDENYTPRRSGSQARRLSRCGSPAVLALSRSRHSLVDVSRLPIATVVTMISTIRAKASSRIARHASRVAVSHSAGVEVVYCLSFFKGLHRVGGVQDVSGM